eukprot:11117102-Lingulodinium_polyedra.AAC.1
MDQRAGTTAPQLRRASTCMEPSHWTPGRCTGTTACQSPGWALQGAPPQPRLSFAASPVRWEVAP